MLIILLYECLWLLASLCTCVYQQIIDKVKEEAFKPKFKAGGGIGMCVCVYVCILFLCVCKAHVCLYVF